MKYLLYLSLALVLSASSCKQADSNATQEQTEAHVGAEMPEDFLAFYDNFHTDSVFQMEHIQFPLQGITADTLQDMRPTTIKWQADEWLTHRPFDDMGGTFNRELFNMNGIIIESIKSFNNEYGMERRFTKQDGEWTLIYYSSMMRM